jgi:hypothetical protein
MMNEMQRALLREESMSLHGYYRKPVVRIVPETNISEACRLTEQNNIGS